jgi:hypothetical protein
MHKLSIFIGPPSTPTLDNGAVKQFLSEPGEKIICGGTTSTVFEKFLGTKASVQLQGYSDGVPPYGFLGSMLVTECTATLEKLTQLFQTSRDRKNAVDEINKRISAASDIKIYRGKAVNKVSRKNKDLIINNFIDLLKIRGKRIDILEF